MPGSKFPLSSFVYQTILTNITDREYPDKLYRVCTYQHSALSFYRGFRHGSFSPRYTLSHIIPVQMTVIATALPTDKSMRPTDSRIVLMLPLMTYMPGR